jgi:hypothetical protein
MSTSPGLSTSNNWGWAETLKTYTCRTWPLTQKWAAKPIGNKSDNTLKKVSTTTQQWLNTTAQENVYKKITKDQVGRIERS